MAAAGTLLAPAVKAADFTAGNETELRNAIAAAAASADPSSTITLTAPIAVSSTPFVDLNGKSVTIVATGANTLSGVDNTNPGTAVEFAPASAGSSLTITGNVRGGDATAAGVPGGHGLVLNGVTLTNDGSITGGDTGVYVDQASAFQVDDAMGVWLTNGTLVNNAGATITGGSGVLNGSAAVGAVLDGGTGHVNNGTIQGGLLGALNGPNPADHSAPPGLLMRNTDLTNNGTILGGFGSGVDGDGVHMFGNSTLVNGETGLIQGTDDPFFSGLILEGGDAVQLYDSGDNTIVNYGTLMSGLGDTSAVIGSGDLHTTGTLTIINHGKILGGNSRTAIDMGNSANWDRRLILEIHGGSTIGARDLDGVEGFGRVLANRIVPDDVLRLAGEIDDSFDVSEINVNLFPQQQKYLGFDLFEKTGSSTWTITGVARNLAVPSPWDIYEGTLLMSAGSDLGNGDVEIFGGTLAGVGIVGPTTNYGPGIRVHPSSGEEVMFSGGAISPGIPGENDGLGELTIDGDYTGNGGSLLIDTVLGDDSSDTDLLIINGDTQFGSDNTESDPTRVFVTNLGGLGDQTVDGIKIVQVEGGSTPGLFELGAPAIAGAYNYGLFQGLPGETPEDNDGDWYLRSIGLSPTVTSYEAYPGVLLGLIDMPTMQQRVGNIYMPSSGTTTDGFVNPEPAADVVEYAPPANLWTRIVAAHSHHEGESDTGTEFDLNRYQVQAGLDGRLGENEDGILIAGVNLQYGHADADVESDLGDSDNSTDSYGGGLTLTWVGRSGFYADAQAMAHYLESDLSLDGVGDLVENNEGWGYGLGLELGRKVALDDAWSITPQAQLYYTSVDFGDFTDQFGADVSLDRGESLKGRIGVALNHDSFDSGESRGHVYAIANLTYEFLDAQSVDVAGVDVEFEPDDFGAELGLGGTYEWAGGTYGIHGEALGQTSFEGSYGVKGTAGFSVRF
ncbi:MAG: autotransporter outer membrane beta-barrel domain-containing protein [Parvibaculaceae bacterium]